MEQSLVVLARGFARMLVAFYKQPFDHETSALLTALTDWISAKEVK